jgi:hypothetical protein
MVWDEANMVTERLNNRMVTESVLMQKVITAVLTGKTGYADLRKTQTSLNIETVPHATVEGRTEGQVNGKP